MEEECSHDEETLQLYSPLVLQVPPTGQIQLERSQVSLLLWSVEMHRSGWRKLERESGGAHRRLAQKASSPPTRSIHRGTFLVQVQVATEGQFSSKYKYPQKDISSE